MLLVLLFIITGARAAAESPKAKEKDAVPSQSRPQLPSVPEGGNATTARPKKLTTTGPRKCGDPMDTEYCFYEGTKEVCDICSGVICPRGKKCVKRDTICAPSCVCLNDVEIEDGNGFCRNPCDLHPCYHKGVCIADANLPRKYRCDCSKEYEGERCEKYHNFCLDPTPSFCPTGEYTCIMHGLNNYSCNCAEGFYHNVTSNQCVKVGERVVIILYFKDTPYSEIYNNRTHPEAVLARKLITAAFEKIYGINLIKLVFNKFTEGSLVAHLDLLLKLHDTGTFRNNEKIFKQFLLDCDTSNQPCFGKLGKAFLPYDGWNAWDERCGNVVCPEHTRCRPIDGKPLRTECVCKSGFEVMGATSDDQGRLIHTCRDIDECIWHPCETVEECMNIPGSYVCATASNMTCPSGSYPIVTGAYSFRCECSWIYMGAQCRFPLTLILLILACFFLFTTIIAVIYAFLNKRRDRTGTYKLYNVPDGMSSTKTVQSSWT